MAEQFLKYFLKTEGPLNNISPEGILLVDK